MRRAPAALLAACVIAGGVAVPVTALAEGPPQVPPGQAKKLVDGVAGDPAAEPTAVATSAPGYTAPEAPATSDAVSTPTRSAPVTKKTPPGQAKKAERTAPVATATPAPVAEPPAPVASAPALAPAPVATVSTATPRPAKAKHAGKHHARKPKTRARTVAASGTTGRVTAPRVVTGPRVAAAVPAPRHSAPARRPAERPAKKAPTRVRTLTRTLTQRVEHVVEVIPAPLRAGLAGLAGVVLLLCVLLGAAALRTRRLERQRRRLAADVGLLQSALLPDLEGDGTGPADVTAAYRPAEGLAAGGDFYDAFALDEHRTAIVVGDVAGHGRDAVPLTASVRYTVRAYLEGGLGPRHVLQVAGRVLDEQLHDRLVTIVVGIYDERTGLLTYASAGHPPPVVVGDDVQPVLAYASPAIGLGVPTGRRQVTVPLPPGAVACFYTDGLADLIQPGGERLGLDRLADAVHALAPDEGARELIARLVRRSTARPDDMAAVVVRAPQDAPAVRAGRIEELEVDVADLRRGRLSGFLAAFGVSGAVAEAAVRAAAEVIGRAGACVMALHHGEGGATVAVEDTPHVIALPLERGAGDVSQRDIVVGHEPADDAAGVPG